jgi:hypothetical protein
MMFLGLSLVYNKRYKCNAHNNYNYIIKTKWNYAWKLFSKEDKAPSKVGLGFQWPVLWTYFYDHKWWL